MGAEPSKGSTAATELLGLHRTMLLIRAVETTLSKLFADSEIPGFIHLSIGQEASAAGVCAALTPADTLATTHRGHGHVLARGMDLEGFFKELMGRFGGRCGGRSGSMHVADMSLGLLGANGIVGAGIPIALGSAMAHQVRQTGGIAVTFFGDGAMAEGALHESLNMAALWRLPLLLVCENNGWSEFSPTARQFKGTLAGLAAAFDLPHRTVDGNDVEAVADAARQAAEQVRHAGPAILECLTARVRGHFEGDPQKYRTADEMKSLDVSDPLRRSAARLAELGVADSALAELSRDIEERVEAAVDAARADASPDFDLAAADVYSPAREN